MQSFEEQLQLLSQQLANTCSPHLRPQAIAPDAYPRCSGSAICQLQPGTSSCMRLSDTTQINSSKNASSGVQAYPEHASCADQTGLQQQKQNHDSQEPPLPELQQLLHTNQQLLVSLIADSWQQQQQQQQQEEEEEVVSAAVLTATSDHKRATGPNRAMQIHQSAGCDHPARTAAAAAGAAPASSKPSCSKWMHAGLQQFLAELDSSTWATTTAAATAASANAQQGEMHRSRGLQDSSSSSNGSRSIGHAGTNAGSQLTVDEVGSSSSSSSSSVSKLLSWLSEMHPTAAVAVGGTVQRCSSQQQQGPYCSRDCFGMAAAAAMLQNAAEGKTNDQIPITDYLQQQQQVCSTHPNIQPVLLLASHNTLSDSSGSSSSGACCMLTCHNSTNAESLLRFSPSSLGGDLYIRFLLYQLLKGLDHLHSRDFALGGFKLDQISLTYPGWMQLLATPAGTLVIQQQQQQIVPWPLPSLQPPPPPQQQQQQQMYVVREPSYSLPQLCEMWRTGVMSNFEYLIWINAAAGRRWGDRKRHPYVPWVIDFSVKPDLSATAVTGSSSSSSSVPLGWRDLGISQYRRIKGDAQLDQTYAMSAAAAGVSSTAAPPSDHHRDLEPWTWPIWGSSSDLSSTSSNLSSTMSNVSDHAVVPPHHISNEPMSELSYAIYMARRLPVGLLVKLVRREFKPEEYPRSIEGLYHSSPDEALPQFYTDPQAFRSLHSSMSDLAVPTWARDAQDLVNIHRAALESDYVSANLHKWIDLNFGVALSGPAGLAAKNIHLKTQEHGSTSSVGTAANGSTQGTSGSSSSSSVGVPITHGVYQLFEFPHPSRCSSSRWLNPLQQLQPNEQLNPTDRQQRDATGGMDLYASTPIATAVAGSSSIAAGLSSSSSSIRSRREPLFLEVAADPPTPPSPGQLALCWAEISSLEAAAAAGSWQAGAASLTAAAAAAGGANVQQQQQQGNRILSSSHNSKQMQQHLIPAVAADLAAVGHVALQLYRQQQQQQITLGRFPDHTVARSGSSISDLVSHQNLGPALPGLPAGVALFVQQCRAGQLSAQGLLHSEFFPSWMEDAWKFMVKLLYSECELHSELHSQPADLHCESPHSTVDGDLAENSDQLANGIGAAAGGAVASCSAAARCWQQCDAFQALAGLAGPSGALQHLALSLDALRLCLPTLMHVIRSKLLHSEAINTNTDQQQQQQQGTDSVDSVCVVVLRAASVLPALLVQQQLLPLLRDMLLTEINAGSADIATEQQQQQHGEQQYRSSSEAARVSACRRAALQPLLWQILLSKVSEQHLLRGLLPLLLAAALEPQHDWLCPCCLSLAAAAAVGDSINRMYLRQESLPNIPAAAAAAAAGRADCSGAPNSSHLLISSAEQQQHQQQQQQPYAAQADLASNCLALLAGSLPLPVVCQHMLRPLLLALPWAGSTACTARGGSNADLQHSMHSTAVMGTDQPPNGAAVALIVIGKVLPRRLAAQFVFRRALQIALLPLLGWPSAAAAAAAATAGTIAPGQHGSGSAAAVRWQTAAALPVLEGLLDHVLTGLAEDLLLPPVGQDFQIPAYVPAAAAAGAGLGTSAAAAAAAGGGTGGSGTPAATFSSSSGKLNPSVITGSDGSSSNLSAAGASSSSNSTPVGQQQQQQQGASDLKLYQLLELLLLLPPDHQAVQDSPLLYPRIVALVLSAIEQASRSNSSSGVNALTPSPPTAASSSSSSMATIVTGWLLPQVLLPLLSPAVAAAWQQHDADQRAYWRSAVLLYAAAVRVLGLKDARAQVPAWHSIEVWLTTETGWEPQQTPSASSRAPDSKARRPETDIPHTLGLLRICADRDEAAAAAAAAAAAMAAAAASYSRSADPDHGATADGVAADSSSSSSSLQNGPALRIIVRQPSMVEIAAESPAAGATAAAAFARTRSGRLDATMSVAAAASAAAAAGSSNLSGRVTHLLQRIAEEKVVRRSLNTTNEFLEGVGWSQPRPLSAAAAAAGEVAAAAAAERVGSKASKQQRQKALAQRAESAPLAAAAASPTAAVPVPITPPAKWTRKERADSTAAAAGWADVTAAPTLSVAEFAGRVPNHLAPATPAAAVGKNDEISSKQTLSLSPQLSMSPPTAAAAAVGSSARRRSWASELSELRLLLESPARQSAAERGPSAGKEWFWLLDPRHEPSHLLPTIHTTAASSSSSSIVSSSSRPWRSTYGVWWEEGWSLSAAALHGWPAHRDKLRALAVDPGERWVVTAGRSSIRADNVPTAAGSSNFPTSLTSPTAAAAAVVRVWELADAETKIQYSGHSAAVHKLTVLGPGSSVVASLDVSGAIHVWSRNTGKPLTTFIPEDNTSGISRLSSIMRPSNTDLQDLLPQPSQAAAAAAASSKPTAASPRSSDAARSFTGAANVFAESAAAAAAASAAMPGNIVAQQQSGSFLARGCSSSRGWQDQPALYTRQLSFGSESDLFVGSAEYSAAAAAGGSVVAAAPAAALAVGGRLGYTCMVNPSASKCPYAYQDTAGYSSSSSDGSSSSDSWHNSCSVLLAGTADGHVCCLDIETGALIDDLVACWEPRSLQGPYSSQQQLLLLQQQQQQQSSLLAGSGPGLYGFSGLEDPLSSVITAVTCHITCYNSGSSGGGRLGSSWIAAGSGSGRVMLLDARAGTVFASWQAHSQRVSQLQGLTGSMGDWQLLSCSLDKTLKLWDLRMLQHSGFCISGSSSLAGFSPLTIYKGSKDGIEGFVVYQDAAIVYGGANLGLAPIDAGSSARQQQQQGWSGPAVTRQIRMTGLRGANRGLGGVSKAGQGLGSSAAVVGLGLLPESKLLVVGQEDGQLRICR